VAITELFAGIPVSDLGAALPWYERLVGRQADLVPHATEVAWQLDATGWIYVVVDPVRAGRALITVLVDDLDAHLAQLTDRGVDPGAIETMPGAARKAEVTDPDGNRITFGQPLG
jgi:predicted enzyme related to lactoylglutathione lyase